MEKGKSRTFPIREFVKRWKEQRRELKPAPVAGVISSENIVDKMLKSEAKWNAIDTMVHEILSAKSS